MSYGSITSFTPDDAGLKVFETTDPLGFTLQDQLLDKQLQAVTKPADYLTARNTEAKKIHKAVYKTYFDSIHTNMKQGKTEPMAKKLAEIVARGNYAAQMAALDVEYPLSAMGVAIHTQDHRNAALFSENKHIINDVARVDPVKVKVTTHRSGRKPGPKRSSAAKDMKKLEDKLGKEKAKKAVKALANRI